MKQESVNLLQDRRNPENIMKLQRNFPKQDHNEMAPIQNSKSEYLRFMNFQRFNVFDSSRQEYFDERSLKILEWKKLIKLISYLHGQYKQKFLTLNDVKGIWPIISFFFPNRTGLFVNQFYQMMIQSRLDINMYENLQQRKKLQELINQATNQIWFKDLEFNKALQVLIKQAKNIDYQEQTKIFNQFISVRNTLQSNPQFKPFIQTLNQSIHNFNFIDPNKKQSVLNTIQDWKDIICNSFFEPDQEQYVLSEPDTLVMDICQTFQDQEYRNIRRKLSQQLQFDDQTETHVNRQTTAKKTPKNQQKNLQQQEKSNQLSKYKRKLNFSIDKPFFSSNEQSQQKTIPIKRQKIIKPRLKKLKNHFSKMIQNQRRIDKKNQKRVKKNENAKIDNKIKNQQNFFVQRQIKKIYFDDSIAIRKQKRSLKQKRNGFKGLKRDQQQQEFKDWKERYIEEQSQVEIISSQMDIQKQYSVSSKNALKKNSRQKRQPRQKVYLNNKFQSSKQVKKRVSSAQRQIKQSSFIVPDDYDDFQDSQTRPKLPRKNHNQSKYQRLKSFERQNNQFISSSKKKQKKNQPSFPKKGKQFTRLKKQGNQEKESQISDNESLFINREQMLQNSETINFQRNQNLKKSSKRNQQIKDKKLNAKYLHLFCDYKKVNNKKNSQKAKPNTLENYFISNCQVNKQHFEPLQRIEVRNLSIFQFQQYDQVIQRMLIVQDDQLNPYQRVRKQICHYEFINQIKKSFSVMDYLSYLESFQSEKQIFSQIKQMSTSYLSNTFEPDFSEDKISNSSQRQNNTFKLVLISRKLLAFYILIKKEKLLQNHNNSSKKYQSFEQNYIKPLLNHYFYKILINMFVEIVNSFFTSEGDEDFSLLNKVSMPFMMLFYDIRQLAPQKIFREMNNFLKNLYEDLYETFNQQSTLILLEIMIDLNRNQNNIKNELKQKVNKIFSNQKIKSYINLPRQTLSLIKKGLKVNLSPINILYSCFTAHTLFEIGVYEKMALIFTTMTTQNFDTSKLKQLRQVNYQKGNYITILQTIPKVILSQNFQDKGVTQIQNLTFLISEFLQKIDIQFDYTSRFSFQCKIITCLLKSFRECSQNTSQVAIMSNYNKNKFFQNQKKENNLNLLKQMLNRSLLNFIECEMQKSSNVTNIMNKIFCQKLPELKLNYQTVFKGEIFIQVDLYLEIIQVMMKFKEFKKNSSFNKSYAIKPINQFFKYNRDIIFAGKNKLVELVSRMFQLMITGYKFQIYDQGKIWDTNNNILTQKTNISLQKNNLTQQYWFVIKQLFKSIYLKCKEFQSLMKSDINGLKSFSSEIQSQKYKNYSSLFNLMLSNVIQNITDAKIYNVQNIYKNCYQENSLSYSLQHILVNVLSLLSEYNFFIDVQFISAENIKKISIFLSPTILSSNLSKLTFINKEIQIQQSLQDEDQQSKQDKLFLLYMDKNDNKKNIILKFLQVLNLKLNYDKIQLNNLSFNNNQNVKYLSVISLIQLMGPILKINKEIENVQNQKQKQKNFPHQNIKPSLFIQFVKKFEYLSWSQSLNGFSVVSKQLQVNQIQNLESSFEFILITEKFITEIQSVKQQNDKDLLGNQLKKRIHSQCYSNKVLLINYLTGVIIKRMIFFDKNHNEYQILTTKDQTQTKKFNNIIAFWCKMFEISHSSLSNAYQSNDLHSVLNIVFHQMTKKRQNITKIPVFNKFLDCYLTVYKQKYHNQSDQKLKNSFPSSFTTICEFLYSYMKQSSIHMNKSQQNNGVKLLICEDKNLILQGISKNYIKLFDTVLKWPALLTTLIQKLKGQFQTLLNGQINSSANKINSHTIPRSLLQNLIIIKADNNQSMDGQEVQNSKNYKKNRQSINLIEQCLKSSELLQANIYNIKETVPNSLFLIVLKKIIQQQVLKGSLNNKKASGIIHLMGNSSKQIQKKKPLECIKLLRQVISYLSQFKESNLLVRVMSSFINFIGCQSQKSSVTCQIYKDRNDGMIKYVQQLHLLGKSKADNYRIRVFITILHIMKQSQSHRLLIERLFWQNVSQIEQFMNMRLTQQQYIRGNNNNNKKDKVSINNLLCQQYQQINMQQCKYVQQIILKCMIGKQSDFYLIKMIINSRIQKLINSTILDNKIAIKLALIKLNLLQKSVIKAIYISSEVNNCREFNAEILKRCNRDLQEWFREKLNHIHCLINTLNQYKNQKEYNNDNLTLRDLLQSINEHMHLNQNNNNSTQNNKTEPNMISFGCKMEIQQ